MDTELIKSIIVEILDKLTVDYERVEITEHTSPSHPLVLIESKDSKLLIGTGGAHLEALNHITWKILRKKSNMEENEQPSRRVLLDVNRYHSEKIEALIYRAERAAERAQLFKRPIELEPMSGFERMIIHAHFTDNPNITTESEGEKQFRRVVIKPSL